MVAPQKTSLWLAAFTNPRQDASWQEQAYFCTALESMRDRIEPIVARIYRDMPGYTVHDITHLDALWETASLVGESHVDLNPPEAFVFGAAVLLHDAAMTVAAYPNGVVGVKATPEWADAIALHKLRFPSASVSIADADATVEVLRQLHAIRAVDLAQQAWEMPTSTGAEKTHLIESSELRHFYGNTIGTIAHSHWWSIDRVERDLDGYLGGYVPKTHLRIDKLKIACLLRIADALHIDRRRAPPFVRALDSPKGISALHWSFQSKLAFPHLEGDAVVFTASEATLEHDADSWWLAHEAISLADRELKDVDQLLREKRGVRLRANRIKGANSPVELCSYIPVSGWRPVDARIRANDVGRIVATLGGAELYGSDPTAPIRELIQNGMDAIQARRRLQGRHPAWGSISIDLSERPDGIWLSVEDNGVGMSERILTTSLLDFGTSFWRSAQALEEFPQLLAKGMNPIGRFGIGFFSIFMLGDQVRVTSRRFDKSSETALVLSFKAGLSSRPTISMCADGSSPIDGGTRIEVKLRHDPRIKDGIRLHVPNARRRIEHIEYPFTLQQKRHQFSSLFEMCVFVAPAPNVAIHASQFGKDVGSIAADDWKILDARSIAMRIGQSDDDCVSRIRNIIDQQGEIVGRAAIWPTSKWTTPGVICSRGLRVQNFPYIFGLIEGDVSNAARDVGFPILDLDSIRRWAIEQRELAERSAMEPEQMALSAEIVLECGADAGSLPIARRGGIWLNAAAIRSLADSSDELRFWVGDVDYEDYDPVPKYEFENDFREDSQIIFVPTLSHSIFEQSARYRRPSCIMALVREVLSEAWGTTGEYDDDNCCVGKVSYQDIERSVLVINKGEDS